ncbi:hypothetical protein DFH11DRAFT_497772 [Phellopilus nigrolimitatus]|nr:hypothetical protein DFH11DRAFT_497772 [Phellopilus nigrolimitatus]
MVRDLGTSAISTLVSRGIPCTRACSRSTAFVRSWSRSIWLHVAVKPLVRPKSTAPCDVFALLVILFVGAILLLGGIFFVHHVYGDILPSWLIVAVYALNLAAVPVLLIISFSRPLAATSSRVAKDIGAHMTPEDYTLDEFLLDPAAYHARHPHDAQRG